MASPYTCILRWREGDTQRHGENLVCENLVENLVGENLGENLVGENLSPSIDPDRLPYLIAP